MCCPDTDEDEEEEDVELEAVVNRRYKPPTSVSKLLEASTWVHCSPHILQEQARVTWWKPEADPQQVHHNSGTYTIYVGFDKG
jgi:hypothetical protein